MDLHLISGAAPTQAERAAIDAVATARRRDLLLPALHATQEAAGWISPGAVNHLARTLDVAPAEIYGVATFYALFSTERGPARVAHVCDDIVCRTKGTGDLRARLERDGYHVKGSPCLGQCERGPAALLDGVRSVTGPAAPARVTRLLQFDDYRALRKAKELGPEGVLHEIVASKLVGRGGAAFPTGRKWEAVARAPERPHFLVCNADESEPGTFKDRLLMEENPRLIVEAMAIAAFATGCERAFIYIRGEYRLAIERISDAVRQAELPVEIEIRRGAGAYVCGEETALFNSIEGKRGEPRNKPPYPVQHGLFGKPTLVNNVETLANVPAIVLEGGAAFPAVETKLFCVSGCVARPGVYEARPGTTLRALLETAGAGTLRAVLLGGAAGTFVTPEEFDLPLVFGGAVPLGSGAVVAFDEKVDLADIVLRIAAFFRDESCGQCVPCRIGTQRQEEILHRMAKGSDEGALLDDVATVMKDASICGLGQSASWAAQSAVRKLRIFRGRSSTRRSTAVPSRFTRGRRSSRPAERSGSKRRRSVSSRR